MRRIILFLFALSCLMATPALAQSDDAPEEGDTPEIRYKERTEIDFQERRVDGDISSPRITLVGGLPDRNFAPLVQLKADFNREMVESSNSIR